MAVLGSDAEFLSILSFKLNPTELRGILFFAEVILVDRVDSSQASNGIIYALNALVLSCRHLEAYKVTADTGL